MAKTTFDNQQILSKTFVCEVKVLEVVLVMPAHGLWIHGITMLRQLTRETTYPALPHCTIDSIRSKLSQIIASRPNIIRVLSSIA